MLKLKCTLYIYLMFVHGTVRKLLDGEMGLKRLGGLCVFPFW